MKAVTAARWSSVPPVSAIFSASKASDSSSGCEAAYATACRIEPNATVGPAARRAASWPTVAASSASGTTCVARPSSRASAAETVRGK